MATMSTFMLLTGTLMPATIREHIVAFTWQQWALLYC